MPCFRPEATPVIRKPGRSEVLKNAVREFNPMNALILFIGLVLFLSPHLSAQEKFYNMYNRGLKYLERADWLRALEELKAASSLEYEDKKNKRTYGTHFIEYFPHREMGVAYFQLGECDNAKRELELSLAYASTGRANEFLAKCNGGYTAVVENKASEKQRELERQKEQEQQARIQKELDEQKEKLRQEQEKQEKERKRMEQMKNEEEKRKELQRQKDTQKKLDAERERIKAEQENLEKERKRISESTKKMAAAGGILLGGLTYDASKIPQVGSRLSLAVLPFQNKGDARGLGEGVSEKLVTQLVNLRRFKVIERDQIDKITKEQNFNLTDNVDEATAAKVGKIIGADVIVLGSINVTTGFAKVSARLIDTETAEAIVAKEKGTEATDLQSIEKKVEELAISIYNEIPLLIGLVIKFDSDESIYIDIGTDKGIRKGTKCVAYREGDEIIHPITKQSLGRKVTPVGELVITQVQEQFSIARIVQSQNKMQVGDKVMIK